MFIDYLNLWIVESGLFLTKGENGKLIFARRKMIASHMSESGVFFVFCFFVFAFACLFVCLIFFTSREKFGVILRLRGLLEFRC